MHETDALPKAIAAIEVKRSNCCRALKHRSTVRNPTSTRNLARADSVMFKFARASDAVWTPEAKTLCSV